MTLTKSDDNENEVDEDDKKKMMIYHQWQLKVRKPTICVAFRPFNFLVQQHENIEPTESNTTNYILFGCV